MKMSIDCKNAKCFFCGKIADYVNIEDKLFGFGVHFSCLQCKLIKTKKV